MKPHTSWSYCPYKPLFFETGDIYISRVEPHSETITFDWLSSGAKSYDVYYRPRFVGEFEHVATTSELTYTITGLMPGMECEFYVEADGKKSRVRLARCGEAVGTIINYLHPHDAAYSFSGQFLASPTIVRHPDGHLLASMDVFKGDYPQNFTLIYRSDDDGASWKYVCELFPCFWGKLFIYNGEVYMISVSTEYGDLLIGKSSDGGNTWSEPVVLLRGSGGKNGEPGVHKNPMPVVEYDGRIWTTLEWGTWHRPYKHPVMVMSAEAGADIMDPESWLYSEPVKYDPSWEGLPSNGPAAGNIEGNIMEINGGLYNVMRYHMPDDCGYGKIIAYKIDTKNPEAPIKFEKCLDLPANNSKFVIQYDERTKKFYTLANRISCPELMHRRNLLSLFSSVDGEKWELVRDVYDFRDRDAMYAGVQYVDWIIEGDEILFLTRVGLNLPDNFHNSNYITFDKIKLD